MTSVSPGQLLTAWQMETPVVACLLAAVVVYAGLLVRGRPRFWRRRLGWWCGAMAACAYALLGAPAVYDEQLLWMHLLQHLLLVFVAAPMLVAAAPLSSMLAAAPREWRPTLVGALRSPIARVVSHPATAWILFAAVMVFAHLTALFQLSLEHPVAHSGEHLLFLSTACLFWAQVLAADPLPHRLPRSLQALYVGLAMIPMAAVATVLMTDPTARYAEYVAAAGPARALADQHAAAGLMWTGGGIVMVAAALIVAARWLIEDERRGALADARAEAHHAG